jgi:hypothetical protein
MPDLPPTHLRLRPAPAALASAVARRARRCQRPKATVQLSLRAPAPLSLSPRAAKPPADGCITRPSLSLGRAYRS